MINPLALACCLRRGSTSWWKLWRCTKAGLPLSGAHCNELTSTCYEAIAGISYLSQQISFFSLKCWPWDSSSHLLHRALWYSCTELGVINEVQPLHRRDRSKNNFWILYLSGRGNLGNSCTWVMPETTWEFSKILTSTFPYVSSTVISPGFSVTIFSIYCLPVTSRDRDWKSQAGGLYKHCLKHISNW